MYVYGRTNKEVESKDATRAQGHSGVCIYWPYSSDVIRLHSCVLSPCLSLHALGQWQQQVIHPSLISSHAILKTSSIISGEIPYTCLDYTFHEHKCMYIIYVLFCCCCCCCFVDWSVKNNAYLTIYQFVLIVSLDFLWTDTERFNKPAPEQTYKNLRTLQQHSDISNLSWYLKCIVLKYKHLLCPWSLSLLIRRQWSISF